MSVGRLVKRFFHPPREARWREFPRHYWKAAGWIVGLTCFVYVLEVSGMLKGFDMAALDSFLRLQNRQESNNVVIVAIGEGEYQEKFEGRSPLCRDALLQLVAKVKSYSPAVIGVDVDTSDAAKPSDERQSCGEDLKGAMAQLMEPQKKDESGTEGQSKNDELDTRVIWAEVPSNTTAPLDVKAVLNEIGTDSRSAGRLTDLVPRKVNGKYLENPANFVGIPRFPIDSDGLVRKYESAFEVTGSLEPGDPNVPASNHLPSLARALVDNSNICAHKPPPMKGAAPLRCPPVEASQEPVIFNFYGGRYRFPTINAREFAQTYDELALQNKDLAETRKEILARKIVLIGGTYRAARDKYPTPLGELAGVELNALAVQSDLSGGGIREEQKWQGVFADVLFGSLVVLVFFAWSTRPRSAFWIAFLGLSGLAVLLSIALFHTASFFFNYMPVIVGMLLHQTIDLANHAGHLKEELDAKKKETKELSRDKQILTDQLVLANLLLESRERDHERARDVKAKARGAAGSR